jgi:hypothetical protein
MFELEMVIIVECEGIIHKETPPRLSRLFGNWLPGDPAYIENLKVYISQGEKRIEITSVLSESDLKMIEKKWLEEQEE